MLDPPPGTRVFPACGVRDMRKGFGGLAALVQTVLAQDPFSGAMFWFRGRRGDLLKILVWDGQGLILVAKRLEKGRFVWPQTQSGVVSLTAAHSRCWSRALIGACLPGPRDHKQLYSRSGIAVVIARRVESRRAYRVVRHA